jgi:putative DNA primase/helicase
MTLAELLTRFSEVQTESDGFLVPCPSHDDSKPSLRLSVSTTGKVLAKCRAGCTTPDVVAALGLSMSDLNAMTAGDITINPATSTSLPASPSAIAGLRVRIDGYASALEHSPRAHDYAVERFGVNDVDIQRLHLGYSIDGGAPRLVVPFADKRGVFRNYQGRALDKKVAVRWLGPHSPEGGSWSPLGWFAGGNGWSELIITEGPGDALTAAAAGYDTIAIAGASRVNSPDLVAEIAEWVGDRTAIIAGDGDPAGRKFSATLAKGLAGHGKTIYTLNLPDGLDLNDRYQTNPEGFQDWLVSEVATITAGTALTRSRAASMSWERDYSLTDLGAARFLRDSVAAEGSGIRYNPETGFYILEGGIWKLTPDVAVRTRAQSMADAFADVAFTVEAETDRDNAAERKRAAKFMKFNEYLHTSRGLDAVMRELMSVDGVLVAIDRFDRDAHLLAFKNGVVDLRSGELREHDANLYITRRIEYDYKPDAAAPRWREFLSEVFPNRPELIPYMQRLVGYSITGSTDEQCFVVNVGRGANGKSVYTDVLTEVFRGITVTTPFQTFEESPSGGVPNDIAALNGARLVFASEGERGKPMAEALLKRITGRDLISARFMRKEFFEFRPKFLLQLSTNTRPNFTGQDEGLWRRVKLIPWDRYFAPSERDPKLNIKLMAEAEGIIAWAVQGAVQWYKSGNLGDPPSIKASTDQYRTDSDKLNGFLPGVYVVDNERGKTKGSDLFNAFKDWADEGNFLDLKRWSSKAFYGALEERGIKRVNPGGVAHFYVRLARPSDREQEWAAPPAEADSPVSQGSETTAAPLQGADLDSL